MQLFKNFFWMNKTSGSQAENGRIRITTVPHTDLWQRTYYGFQNNNAPAWVTEMTGDFTLSVKACFDQAAHMYDQCGILIHHDTDCWIKASVELENQEFSRLGSVVTNLGYSDWATCDIPSGINTMWYRVSRRGQDFYLESSGDGKVYEQMRMCHLYNAPEVIRAGVYACSPLDSAFNAEFSDLETGPCIWPVYMPHE